MMAKKSNGVGTNGAELWEIVFDRKLCTLCLCTVHPFIGISFVILYLSLSLNKYQNKAEIHHVELCENHATMHLEHHSLENFLKILISST